MVRQHGATNVGCLLAMLVIIIVLYGGYKFGPPFLDDYQLRNATVRIAGYAAAGVLADTKYGTVRGQGEIEQIREAVPPGSPGSANTLEQREHHRGEGSQLCFHLPELCYSHNPSVGRV